MCPRRFTSLTGRLTERAVEGLLDSRGSTHRGFVPADRTTERRGILIQGDDCGGWVESH